MPKASRQARSLAWRLGCGSGDTMNALAPHDIEAADVLVLARLDDDGAPCPCGLPRAQPGRPVPDMIATAHEARGTAAPARDQRRPQRAGPLTWPAPAGDRQPAGHDRGSAGPGRQMPIVSASRSRSTSTGSPDK